VAVKFLHPHLLAAGQNVARFLREAEAASALQSPNVVRVLEVGDSSEQIPYIAMERLQGHDLAYHLRSERRFAPVRSAEVVRAVAGGLDEAAEAGIVHRDIKPQNIFLSEVSGGEAVWKILDFGLSKLMDSQGTLTRGDIVGTPVYMAPEQARGEAAGPAADRYSLGAIAYRVLTGHPPFNAPEVWSILHAVIHDMPRAPSRLAEIGVDVERVLLIAMAKRPEDRFDTARALADALESAVDDSLDDDLRQRADALLDRHPWR
jgi:serine/threonine-protein kinase